MNIQELFSSAANQIDFDKVQEKITAEMQKTFERALIEEIGGYGSPFKKEIESKIRAMLGVAAGELDVSVYASSVSQLAAKTMHDSIVGEAQKQLKTLLETITQQAPETIKLSQIVDAVKKYNYGSDNEECTLKVNTEECFTYIYIHADENKKDHECSIRLSIIHYGKGLSEPQNVSVWSYKDIDTLYGIFSELDKYMFWLSRCGTKLIVDEDECDTHYEECHCTC